MEKVMMRHFDIIVAVDRNNGIGRKNSMPWKLKGDLQYFYNITSKTSDTSKQNAIIMGRKTFESLPVKPLAKRVNIVLSTNLKLDLPQHVIQAISLDDALVKADTCENIFVIGGGILYELAIQHPMARYLYFTRIDHIFDCDAFFATLPANIVEESVSELFKENELTYQNFKYCLPQYVHHNNSSKTMLMAK